MKTILHVDMDAFFASVELLHHPEWRGKPLVVGSGPHERGVVSTCSYEARKFGVHSAMASQMAYRLCPQAIFVRPHMELYAEASEKVFDIFRRYTPFVEGVSIDEAFLDITGSLHLFGGDADSARKLGEDLRATVRRECGLTCSVGIAPNRLLAKIGSEQHKPDGLTVMPFEEKAIAEFLRPKRIGILWGIGARTEELLKPYDITTCGDLQKLDEETLARLIGSDAYAKTLHDHAFGRDETEVAWESEAEKSVSREYTFPKDETCRAKVRAKLLELVEDVGRRFRAERRWAKTARIKIRNGEFETFTRQTAFDAPSRDDITFREKALELFDRERNVGTFRLIGFGVTNIENEPRLAEALLFGDEGETKRKKRERLSEAMDSLRERGLID